MQSLSINHVPNETISHIVDELPYREMTVCLRINSRWSEIILKNQNYIENKKTVQEWPRVLEIPERIVNIFGSISKLNQVPYVEFSTQDKEGFRTNTVDLEKSLKETLEDGINGESTINFERKYDLVNLKWGSRFDAKSFFFRCLKFDRVKEPITYWAEQRNGRPHCTFKVKYSDSTSGDEKIVLIDLFRKAYGNPEEIEDRLERKEFLKQWNIYCYLKDKSCMIPVQKMMSENNPFKILKALNFSKSILIGTQKLELVAPED